MKILMYTHELSYTGAPTSLLRIAKVLSSAGHELVLWSKSEGGYAREFDLLNIKVRIVPDYDIANNVQEIMQFDIAIANTIVSYRFYDECRKYIPTIWYIREAQNIKSILGQNKYWANIFTSAEELYCVSEYASDYIYQNYNKNVKVIHNCVEDFYTQTDEEEQDKEFIDLLMLGSITERKGFQIAVRALNQMENQNRNRVRIQFAGQIVKNADGQKYYSELINLIGKMNNVEYLGEISNKEKIIDQYKKADVVLVPSQDESCSLVVLEGTMMCKPIIVSENVGAKYMVDESNGWIFETDNVDGLCDIFNEIANMSFLDLKRMGMASRIKYEEMASMDKYKVDILNLIEKYGNMEISYEKKIENTILSYKLLNDWKKHLEGVVRKKETTINETKKKYLSEISRMEQELKHVNLENFQIRGLLVSEGNGRNDVKKDVKILKKSKLFDKKWYREQYLKEYRGNLSEVEHYYFEGWRNGTNPSKYFSTNSYIELNNKKMEFAECPLVHFEKNGRDIKFKIKLTPAYDRRCDLLSEQIKLIMNSEFFNSTWYRKKYTISDNVKDLAKHYLTEGWKMGYNPSPKFSTYKYFRVNKDVERANICPLLHYEKIGKHEGRSIESLKINVVNSKYSSELAKTKLIVSLTASSGTINSIYRTLNSILEQTLKPSKIILTVSRREFPLQEFPLNVRDIIKQNVEVIWGDDISQFNRFIPVKEKYPNDIVVIADEDVLYPNNWLETLYQSYLNDKNFVHCFEARSIVVVNEKLRYCINDIITTFKPAITNIPYGKMGILFPPTYNIDIKKERIPYLDIKNDIMYYWMWSVLLRVETKIIDANKLNFEGNLGWRYTKYDIENDLNYLFLNYSDIKTILNECESKSEEFKKIKFVVPTHEKSKEYNGDYHYAIALKDEFERNGFTVDFRFIGEWYAPFDGKFVVVFRGPLKYKCNESNHNIMWNISHPEDVELSEYGDYDNVFIASLKWSNKINEELYVAGYKTIVKVLYQCTDLNVFGKTYEEYSICRDVLFVGMKHPEGRKIVEDIVPCEFGFSLYGPRWENTIYEEYLRGSMIENDQLGFYYNTSKITLNDTRPEMKENGFVSNRLFDIFAAGGFVISDEFDEVKEIFGDLVVTYNGSREDLLDKISFYLENDEERKRISSQAKKIVEQNHTFKHRVEEFLKVMMN